jgi:hypothetical protein
MAGCQAELRRTKAQEFGLSDEEIDEAVAYEQDVEKADAA